MNSEKFTDYILVVGDDEEQRELLADVLDMIGFNVSVAANECQALGDREDGPFPSLILLQSQPPATMSHDLRKCLRQNPRFADLPVIDLTSMADIALDLAVLQAEHQFRPIDLETLIQTIDSLCLQRCQKQ